MGIERQDGNPGTDNRKVLLQRLVEKRQLLDDQLLRQSSRHLRQGDVSRHQGDTQRVIHQDHQCLAASSAKTLL